MTMPTKEQIDKITRKLVKGRVKLLKSCGFSTKEICTRVSVADVNSYVEDTITEWEKIRNKGATRKED